MASSSASDLDSATPPRPAVRASVIRGGELDSSLVTPGDSRGERPFSLPFPLDRGCGLRSPLAPAATRGPPPPRCPPRAPAAGATAAAGVATAVGPAGDPGDEEVTAATDFRVGMAGDMATESLAEDGEPSDNASWRAGKLVETRSRPYYFVVSWLVDWLGGVPFCLFTYDGILGVLQRCK